MTPQGPILSIVIATRNQLNSLKFTLLTLQDQSPDAAHEIIVVDAASSDGTAQFLTGQAEKGRLRPVLETRNQVRTACRNQGARTATGRFLMFLDPGMVVGPHWWEAPLRVLQKDPLVGAAAGKVILPDGRIDHAGQAVLEIRTDTGTRLMGRSIHAGQPAQFKESLQSLQVQGLAGEGLMVRASAFFAVGGFDEGLGRDFGRNKSLGEAEPAGLDLSLRLGDRGWTRVYRPESIMTRLRVSEEVEGSDPKEDALLMADDQALLTASWSGKIRPDFRVVPGAGVRAHDQNGIRPYLEPVLAFSGQSYHRTVSPGDQTDSIASVVVLTYNALEYTRRCVASLLEHTDPRHELILVDNGSTDGTAEFLRKLAAENDRIRIRILTENLGYPAGNNHGLAMATGRNIVLLNSDTVVTKGWLDRLLAAAEANPRAGLFGAVTNNISGLQKIEMLDYNEETLAGLDDFSDALARDRSGQVQRALRLTGFCLMIRRELLARIGGLDEIFGRGNFEDNDYCLRSHLAGYDNLIVRDCFVHHFGGKSFQAAGVDYQELLEGQWEIFKKKWDIPAVTPYNAPVDLSRVLDEGFDPDIHFHPLPDTAGDISEAVACK